MESAQRRLKNLPKVELHLHADGACRTSTLFELSKQRELGLPDDIEEFKSCVCLKSKKQSLVEFLQVFPNIAKIISTRKNLMRIAKEYCEDCSRDNIIYAEYRFNPFACRQYGLQPSEYIEAVCDGLDAGQKDFPVKVRQILCFKREEPDNAMEIVKLAVQYRSRGVVGVDIAGDETLPMDQRFIDAFRMAKKQGLHITVHAGESGPAANIKEAIEVLGAERIGHGYHILDDYSVLELAKKKGVHFEACPTSSIFTASCSEECHAILSFVKENVSFSLSTDDPGVIQCNILDEYTFATCIGLSEEVLIESVFNAANAAFLPDEEKQELLQTLAYRMKLYKASSEQ